MQSVKKKVFHAVSPWSALYFIRRSSGHAAMSMPKKYDLAARACILFQASSLHISPPSLSLSLCLECYSFIGVSLCLVLPSFP